MNHTFATLCPHDGTPMLGVQMHGVELDHCDTCLGSWVDRGELELIGKLLDTEPGALYHALQTEPFARSPSRRCPRCGRRLELVQPLGAQVGPTLDRCPVGDGFFLDHGELEALFSAMNGGQERGGVVGFLADLFAGELGTAHTNEEPGSNQPRR